MSSNDDENNINDPLYKERAKAKSLISMVLSENLLKKKNNIKIYDPIKHGDIIIINAEIINKKLKNRIKLKISKKIDK